MRIEEGNDDTDTVKNIADIVLVYDDYPLVGIMYTKCWISLLSPNSGKYEWT